VKHTILLIISTYRDSTLSDGPSQRQLMKYLQTKKGSHPLTVVLVVEVFNLALRLFAGTAIALLHQTGQLRGIPFHLGPLIIRNLAPDAAGFTGQLFPFAFERVLIHTFPLSRSEK